MTALQSNKNIKQKNKSNLFNDYPWFYSNIYSGIQKITDDFFQKDFFLRLMSLSKDENILFYGDEYFVNKVPVTKISDIKIKISSGAVSALLDNALGLSESPFNLKNLTDIEAMLIKAYTAAIYKSIEKYLNKAEVNQKIIKSSKDYDLTFFLRANEIHSGKIIISIPEYMVKIESAKEPQKTFSNVDFKNIKADMSISAGSSKITLNDIKAIEEGDIILLENSNINEMSVLWQGRKVPFRINPNPSLIISIDNTGGSHMEDENNSKSQNMWDSILVDIVAEFDNVRLTLGELKQISEGLVIDVGSVYENKIKLRVENQVVATGELVILNDRYGVRVNEVIKSKDTNNNSRTQTAGQPQKPKNNPNHAGNAENHSQKNDDDSFDYSDFEIEDESI